MTNAFPIRSLALLAALLLAAQAHGQGHDAPGEKPSPARAQGAAARSLDQGRLAGTEYVNDLFGLSLSVPQNWIVASAQRQEQVAQESRQTIVAENDRKRAQLDDSFERSKILLSLTKLPAGQPANASFMLVAERVPSPMIRNGADVLRSMEALSKGTNFSAEFVEPIGTQQLGGAEFGVALLRNRSPYGVFMQKWYVTNSKGYALEFVFTYTNDADLAVFESIMKSVRIK